MLLHGERRQTLFDAQGQGKQLRLRWTGWRNNEAFGRTIHTGHVFRTKAPAIMVTVEQTMATLQLQRGKRRASKGINDQTSLFTLILIALPP